MPYPTYMPDPPPGKKWVSFYIGSTSDEVVDITLGTTTYSKPTCDLLVANASPPFYYCENATGPSTDLCFLLDTTTTSINGYFKHTGSGTPYTLPTNDFDYIGGRWKPKPR